MGFFDAVQSLGRYGEWKKQDTMDQADIELRQQQVAQGRMAMETARQQNILRAQIGQQIAAEEAKDNASVQDPMQQAQRYRTAERQFLAVGDFEASTRVGKIADEMVKESKEATEALMKKKQLAKEDLATAANAYISSPSALSSSDLVRAAVAAGVDPLSIPAPGTPAFKTWVEQQTRASMSGAEQVKLAVQERKAADDREQRKEFHADMEEDKRLQRQAIAAQRESTNQLRLSEIEARKESTQQNRDFQQTERLNKTVQTAAKPYLEDRQRIQSVKNALSVDNAEADQQVRQSLTALLGNFKGRATNLFYKDNKNYGDVVNRLSGMLSHAFTGRYSEADRTDIFYMLDHMEKGLIDPALSKLETSQKARAKAYGLDPDLVEIQGDFNRDTGTAKAAPKTSGGSTHTVAIAPAVKYLKGVKTQADLQHRVMQLKEKGWSEDQIREAFKGAQ